MGIVMNVNQSSDAQSKLNRDMGTFNDNIRHKKLISDGMRIDDKNGKSRSQYHHIESKEFFNAQSDNGQTAIDGANQQAPPIMLTSSQSHIVFS